VNHYILCDKFAATVIRLDEPILSISFVKKFSIKKLGFRHCGPVDLQINASEIIGLSGASGSGKTLFLRALADMDEHTGEVQLDEVNQQSIEAHLWRRKVALLSAETSWWLDTLEEHFSALSEQPLQALGFPPDCLHWSVSRLSSGEKQRLGLLRLLENRPEVLLLDEPTANLDEHSTVLFEQFVQRYLHEHSACAIWVSHDTQQLNKVCQRKYLLESGVLNNVD